MEGMETRVFMAVCMLLGLVSIGVAAPGTATFYEPHEPSDCPGVKEPGRWLQQLVTPSGTMEPYVEKEFNMTCLGPPSTSEKFPCKGSVVVTVVDRCPAPRCDATLELSRLAFDKIVDPTLVMIIIDYKAV